MVFICYQNNSRTGMNILLNMNTSLVDLPMIHLVQLISRQKRCTPVLGLMDCRTLPVFMHSTATKLPDFSSLPMEYTLEPSFEKDT